MIHANDPGIHHSFVACNSNNRGDDAASEVVQYGGYVNGD